MNEYLKVGPSRDPRFRPHNHQHEYDGQQYSDFDFGIPVSTTALSLSLYKLTQIPHSFHA